jgi:NADPH-dependent curcumin reductase CurA
VATEIRLRRRPRRVPEPDDFEVAEVPDPVPVDGQVLVRSVLVSVDPGQRSRMRDADAPIGAVPPGSALGTVTWSGGAGVPVGAMVRGRWGWRDVAAVAAAEVTVVEPVEGIPVAAELGALGVPGLTAYVGLLDIGAPRPGETVFVSGAAGAVGSVVAQIAKIKGCRVVGSAGTDEKVAALEAVGVDAAFNYRRVSPADGVRSASPDGIDLYFDNVGGEHLQAALDHLRPHGRVVCCGSVSAYNDDGPGPAIHNLRRFVTSRLTMRGFVIWDHMDRVAAHRADTVEWLRGGRLVETYTFTDGLENTPGAFIGMLRGANVGKALVRV